MKKPTMKIEDLFNSIEEMGSKYNLSFLTVLETLKHAITKSFEHKYDPDASLSFEVDAENKIFKLINNSKFVVEDTEITKEETRSIEIPFTLAKKINSEIKVGDVITEEVDFSLYPNFLIQQIWQIFIKSIKEQHRSNIYDEYKHLKGQIVDMEVIGISGSVILKVKDEVIALMPNKLRNPRIKLKIGNIISIYVEDVLHDERDAQIIVSNTSTQILVKIIAEEIPDVANGIIEIKKVARIAGVRSKIAVLSNANNVDAIGSIIGSRGSRIESIKEKLSWEKLDVVPFNSDLTTFIANAVSPARVVSIIAKQDSLGEAEFNSFIIVTPDAHQTLAIGVNGTNIKLAATLTDTKLDVLSITEARNQNLDVNWNGNLTKEELALIESGEKIPNASFSRREGNANKLNLNSLDDAIFSFQEEIKEVSTSPKEMNFDSPRSSKSYSGDKSNFGKTDTKDYAKSDSGNLKKISNLDSNHYSDEDLESILKEFEGFTVDDSDDFGEDE